MVLFPPKGVHCVVIDCNLYLSAMTLNAEKCRVNNKTFSRNDHCIILFRKKAALSHAVHFKCLYSVYDY